MRLFRKSRKTAKEIKEFTKNSYKDIKSIPDKISGLDGEQMKFVFIAVPVMLVIMFGITKLLSSISTTIYLIFTVITGIFYLWMVKNGKGN